MASSLSDNAVREVEQLMEESERKAESSPRSNVSSFNSPSKFPRKKSVMSIGFNDN